MSRRGSSRVLAWSYLAALVGVAVCVLLVAAATGSTLVLVIAGLVVLAVASAVAAAVIRLRRLEAGRIRAARASHGACSCCAEREAAEATAPPGCGQLCGSESASCGQACAFKAAPSTADAVS